MFSQKGAILGNSCFLLTHFLPQVPSLGIRQEAITFASCTMQSEKYITVREQAGESVMIHIIDLQVRLCTLGDIYIYILSDLGMGFLSKGLGTGDGWGGECSASGFAVRYGGWTLGGFGG